MKSTKANETRKYRKSPARTKSPVRTKSPARTKSPSRTTSKPSDKSPVKSKSPARQKSPPRTKSPSRTASKTSDKSPARTVPKTSEKSPARTKSPARKEKVKAERSPKVKKVVNRPRKDSTTEDESDSDQNPSYVTRIRGGSRTKRSEDKQTARVSPLNTINGMAERVTTSIGVMTRRALRSNSQTKDADNVPVYREKLDTIYNKTEFSDLENEPVFENYNSLRKKSATPKQRSISVDKDRVPTIKIEKEFGGTLGTIFFSLVILISPVFFQLWCTKDKCEYSKLPNLKPLLSYNWKNIFDLDVVLSYIGFHILHALFFIIPFGGPLVEGPMFKYGKKHRANAPFACFVITTIIFALEYYKVPIFDILYRKQFRFVMFSIIFGLVHSIYLYIRSYFVKLGSLNIHANTNSRYYNFFMGREIRPMIGGLIDVKQLLFRSANHLAAVIYLAYVIRSFGAASPFDLTWQTITIKPTLLLLCVLQCIFFLDPIFFERTYLSSFEMQTEGVGFMAGVGYAIWPFTVTILGKYILEHNIEHPMWYLAILLVIDIIGIAIYRGSNTQKHEFRQNPFNPALAHLETIPTSQGKKLLVSGYWGVVRRPNYVGDLLMELSWFLFAPTSPAAFGTLPFIATFLVHRIIRDNARCKQKYGAAWDRYCERVKYNLIPKVY